MPPVKSLESETPDSLYAALTAPGVSPTWPSEDTQRLYTGAAGSELVGRTLAFLSMLDADGAFKPGWKGLDYGVGWGRMASLMLHYGTAQQLDVCDAWQETLELFKQGRFSNHAMLVHSTLAATDLPKDTYDFTYAYSIFTHLHPDVMINNLKMLLESVKPDGTVYFTIRHKEFLDAVNPSAKDLADYDAGYWFVPARDDAKYGDFVPHPDFMRDKIGALGKLRPVGAPLPVQHLYALSRA